MKPRLPPQNLQAERYTLGCQLADPRMIDDVREVLSPNQFYSDVHATVQKALFKLRDGGAAIDPALLAAHLESIGQLEDIGGIPYLLELMEAFPVTAHAVHYAKLVVKAFRRREALKIAERLAEQAYDETKDETEISEDAIQAATDLAEYQSETVTLTEMETACMEVVAMLRTGKVPAVWVTIPEVDEMTSGLAPGELVVIGARTGNGKSLYAVQCLDIAASHDWPGLICSEEMARLMVASRQIASLTEINSEAWIDRVEYVEADIRKHFVSRAKVVIAEKCSTIAAIERIVAKAVRLYGIRIMALDYAQLVRGAGDNEAERIADVCHRAKGLATKYNLIVLLLAQLNRGLMGRDNAEPRLSDFKGSGALEEDADVVLCPFWPIKIDEKYSDEFEYRIYQLKNRNRGIRSGKRVLKMRIDPERQRIYPDSSEWNQQALNM